MVQKPWPMLCSLYFFLILFLFLFLLVPYFFPIFLFSSFLFFSYFFSTFIILMISKKCWLLNDMDICICICICSVYSWITDYCANSFWLLCHCTSTFYSYSVQVSLNSMFDSSQDLIGNPSARCSSRACCKGQPDPVIQATPLRFPDYWTIILHCPNAPQQADHNIAWLRIWQPHRRHTQRWHLLLPISQYRCQGRVCRDVPLRKHYNSVINECFVKWRSWRHDVPSNASRTNK